MRRRTCDGERAAANVRRRTGEGLAASAREAVGQRQRMAPVRPKSTTRRRVSQAHVARHTTGPAAEGPEPVRCVRGLRAATSGVRGMTSECTSPESAVQR